MSYSYPLVKIELNQDGSLTIWTLSKLNDGENTGASYSRHDISVPKIVTTTTVESR